MPPVMIQLAPVASESSFSASLTTGATPSAYAGTAVTMQPYTAAELHAHEWPPTPLEGVPMLAATAYVVVRGSFRYHYRAPERRKAR
jgi:hypothetical protein